MLHPTTPNLKRLSENSMEFMHDVENFNDFSINQLCQLPNGMVLNKFITLLDKEIRKLYMFYNNVERELYIQINSRLHYRKNYE